MRKTLYILIISLAASLAISGCTEEDIKPSHSANGGGGGSDPL